MIDDEDDLDNGADKLLPDSDTKDSLLNELLPASTKIMNSKILIKINLKNIQFIYI